MIRKNIYITEPQHEGLKKLAEKSGCSMSEHMRNAIDEYLFSRSGTNSRSRMTAKQRDRHDADEKFFEGEEWPDKRSWVKDNS